MSEVNEVIFELTSMGDLVINKSQKASGVVVSENSTFLIISGVSGLRDDGSICDNLLHQIRDAKIQLSEQLEGHQMRWSDLVDVKVYLHGQEYLRSISSCEITPNYRPVSKDTPCDIRYLYAFRDKRMKVEIDAIAIK